MTETCLCLHLGHQWKARCLRSVMWVYWREAGRTGFGRIAGGGPGAGAKTSTALRESRDLWHIVDRSASKTPCAGRRDLFGHADNGWSRVMLKRVLLAERRDRCVPRRDTSRAVGQVGAAC